MIFSLWMSRNHGKDIVHLYDLHVYSLTMYMEDVAPRRSILCQRLLRLLGAKSIVDGHPLDGIGGDLYFRGHTPHVSYTIHFLRIHEENLAAN